MKTNHDPQPVPDNIRMNPYDNPDFEALCREMSIWGTAQAALCAVFWRQATAAAGAWIAVIDADRAQRQAGPVADHVTDAELNRALCALKNADAIEFSDMKRALEGFAADRAQHQAVQPVIPPGYVPLPKPASVSVTDSDPGSVDLRDNYTAQQMHDYVAADRAQRQALWGAIQYEATHNGIEQRQDVQEDALACDFCGSDTPDPWHGSTAYSKHLHACEACLHLLPGHAPQPAPFDAQAELIKRMQTVIEQLLAPAEIEGAPQAVQPKEIAE